jgi:hypothetical protein
LFEGEDMMHVHFRHLPILGIGNPELIHEAEHLL